MKPSVPVLTPLLRSDMQGKLLAELYLHPEKERTATELAHRVGTSLPNASRELNRMVTAGYLTVRSSGRNRYLRVNDQHPLYQPVADILRYAYGPVSVLAAVLGRIEGVEQAFIYGSWAARLSGEAGPDPQDIDLLVVGDNVDLDALDEEVENARIQLGREVNPYTVSSQVWSEGNELFIRHLKARPLVQISLEPQQ